MIRRSGKGSPGSAAATWQVRLSRTSSGERNRFAVVQVDAGQPAQIRGSGEEPCMSGDAAETGGVLVVDFSVQTTAAPETVFRRRNAVERDRQAD